MMKNRWFAMANTLLLTVGIAAGCTGIYHPDAMGNHVLAGGNPIAQPVYAAVPELEAQLIKEGNKATISYTVKNFKLSAEHFGKKHVSGEGHLHLVVDGEPKVMMKEQSRIILENIPPGKHTIKLTLQQNDHKPLHVEKEFHIEVKGGRG
ncbi:DUF6130 family protein [Paenibacillus larvae]|nr:DUF6130 family protein [Paenibacillus larvae]MDT2303657.1 DUF6130 family protein [Paenibacillus larvae]